MAPPIVLDYNGDFLVFDSVRDAEAYAEPIDVENAEFIASDSTGRLLDVSLSPSDRVVLRNSAFKQVVSNDVLDRIRAFLRHGGMREDDVANLGIRELIALLSIGGRTKGWRQRD